MDKVAASDADKAEPPLDFDTELERAEGGVEFSELLECIRPGNTAGPFRFSPESPPNFEYLFPEVAQYGSVPDMKLVLETAKAYKYADTRSCYVFEAAFMNHNSYHITSLLCGHYVAHGMANPLACNSPGMVAEVHRPVDSRMIHALFQAYAQDRRAEDLRTAFVNCIEYWGFDPQETVGTIAMINAAAATVGAGRRGDSSK